MQITCLLIRVGEEAVADAAHGEEVLWVGGVVFDVAAEADDEVVEGVEADGAVVEGVLGCPAGFACGFGCVAVPGSAAKERLDAGEQDAEVEGLWQIVV